MQAKLWTGETTMFDHQESHRHAHPHTHGVIDPAVQDTQRGIRAVKSSSFLLLVTGLLQLIVVLLSNSAALLADAIHNLADVATAFPLWIAFALSRLKPTNRFTYGYGRVEDLAGLVVIIVITVSGIASGYVAIDRLFHPQPITYLGMVVAASLVGFFGNEGAAMIRIKAGKEIGSAALIADGYHARADGFTSLAVLLGATGVWLGYPLADPAFGLMITLVIFLIVWESGKNVFTRLLDGVDPQVVEEIREAARETPGVSEVSEARVRWIGHRLHAELNVAVNPDLSIKQAHDIAKEVRHTLLHQLQYLSNATIHLDPLTASGETHHRIREHAHDELPLHSH